MQSVAKLEFYFSQTMPALMAGLQYERSPEWGTMNATQMLYHLNDTVKLSMEVFPVTEYMIQEKWEKYKTVVLLSSRPLAKNITNPIFNLLVKDKVEHEQAKQNLIQSMILFKQYFADKGQAYTTIHNLFGRLNYHEWLWFHYKHFSHHFAQFGLAPYIEHFELE